MDFTEQGPRAAKRHPTAFAEGKTCIDCHQGIAHQLPPIDQHIGERNEGMLSMSSSKAPEEKK